MNITTAQIWARIAEIKERNPQDYNYDVRAAEEKELIRAVLGSPTAALQAAALLEADLLSE